MFNDEVLLPDQRIAALRAAIESLIDLKLLDALARPDGVARLVAHRSSGVASRPIRQAERELENTLSQCLPDPSSHNEPQRRSTGKIDRN